LLSIQVVDSRAVGLLDRHVSFPGCLLIRVGGLLDFVGTVHDCTSRGAALPGGLLSLPGCLLSLAGRLASLPQTVKLSVSLTRYSAILSVK